MKKYYFCENCALYFTKESDEFINIGFDEIPGNIEIEEIEHCNGNTVHYSISAFSKGGSYVDLPYYASRNYLTEETANKQFETITLQVKKSDIIDMIILYKYENGIGTLVREWKKPEMTLGQLLKEKRLEQGMTQQDVADKIGSPLVTYQRWEYNNCSPSAKYLIKLQSALEISADDLEGLL